MSQELPPGLPHGTLPNTGEDDNSTQVGLQQHLGLHHLQSIWTTTALASDQHNPLLIGSQQQKLTQEHLIQQQHLVGQQYQLMQRNADYSGQYNHENSLPMMTPDQEQQLLLLLQQSWLPPHQAQSPNSLQNVNIDQSALNSHPTAMGDFPGKNNNSTHVNSFPIVQHGHRSYSVNQDPYEGTGVPSGFLSMSDSTSNSLHRSSSDLGTRITSYHMDLGDLTSSASNVPDYHSSTMYSDKPLGHLTMPAHQSIVNTKLTDDTFIQALMEPVIRQTSPSLRGTTGMRDCSLLDNTPQVQQSYDASGYDRAPGTPLSQTPPPKVVQENSISSPNMNSPSGSLINGSLNNLPNGLTTGYLSRDSQTGNTSSSLSNKGKKTKKLKSNISQNKKSAKVQEVPISESQERNEYAPQFSFYSNDQNLLFEKMGNLSSQIVNWISCDKSTEKKISAPDYQAQKAKPATDPPEKKYKVKIEHLTKHNSSSLDGIVPLPTPAVTKASLTNKLSYSDVLNSSTSSKNLQEKCSLDQTGYSSGSSQSLENSSNSNSCNKYKSESDNNNTVPFYIASFQPYHGPNKKSAAGANPACTSPLLCGRKKSATNCSVSNLFFGSRVGLDEFRSPTVEELASTFQYSGTANCSPTSLGSNSKQDESAASTPTHASNKKKKGSASLTTPLNNNNKVSNQKQALK